MKILNRKTVALTTFCAIALGLKSYAQQGHVTINQNERISRLMEVKKEMDKDENAADRYKIQIYSGSRSNAEEALEKYKNNYEQWNGTLVYETPNYKVWIGSFRTRLEADRALVKIKEHFTNGFIFKPKIKN